MDDVVEFPRARVKPLSEADALDALRRAGRIEGIGAFATLAGWERTGASRVVGQWERDGKVVRTPRPGYPTVIEAVVGGVPAVHTAIAPPVLHTPAQPAPWWRRVVGRRAHPVPQPAAQPAHPAVPASRDRITLLTALAMATVSAGFSIYGLTGIFSGAFLPVIALGVALEAGKLRGIFLIGSGRGPWSVRAGLVIAVVVLMGLNAVGAYGFLAKAHIAATEKAKAATEAANKATAARLADINGRIEVATSTLANIDKKLGEIGGAINAAIARGKVNAAMTLANEQRNTRTTLEVDRAAAGRTLADLKVEKAKIEPSPGKKDESSKKDDETKAKEDEAELGPVRHLAALLGADSDTALRWFMLVVACLLDPLAVLLLLAASQD
jgi:hypothetical protein